MILRVYTILIHQINKIKVLLLIVQCFALRLCCSVFTFRDLQDEAPQPLEVHEYSLDETYVCQTLLAPVQSATNARHAYLASSSTFNWMFALNISDAFVAASALSHVPRRSSSTSSVVDNSMSSFSPRKLPRRLMTVGRRRSSVLSSPIA